MVTPPEHSVNKQRANERAASAHEAKRNGSTKHTPPPVAGQRPGPVMLHHGTRWVLAGFAVPYNYFFATWSSLVHNLGALDWLSFLFSL
jgi:hypothetical protein